MQGGDPCGGLGKEVSGTITDDDGDVCVLKGELTIEEGASLTIKEGVVVKSEGAALKVRGRLTISGTKSDPIVFTSIKDDEKEDTNDDGTATGGAAGQWAGIRFEDGSEGSISNAQILYAKDGVFTSESAPSFKSVTFKHCSGAAVSASPVDEVKIDGFEAKGCAYNGVLRRVGVITRDTSWAETDVVHIIQEDTSATGITVDQGKTLTIGPGMIIKGGYPNRPDVKGAYSPLRVRGTLLVNGEPDSPVIFTSLFDDADDANGNSTDTTSDGGESKALPGNFAGILFEAGSNGSLTALDVRYPVSGIRTEGAAVTAESLSVQKCSRAAVDSAPGDRIELTTAFDTEYCAYNGVLRRPGVITEDVTWDADLAVHIVEEDTLGTGITVDEDVKLTIGPGVIVKGGYPGRPDVTGGYSTIRVRGALEVLGDTDRPVTFTSLFHDAKDANGEKTDTTGDGGETEARRGNFGGIAFEEGSVGTLKNLNIQYAVSGFKTTAALVSAENLHVSDCSRAAIDAPPADEVDLLSTFLAEGCTYNGVLRRAETITSDTTWDATLAVHIIEEDTSRTGITVDDGAKLTIGPGMVIKGGYPDGPNVTGDYSTLRVKGTLEVAGEPNSPVIFTSLYDDVEDAAGKKTDTTGDGGDSSALAGNFGGISFSSDATGTISNARIYYATTGVKASGASVTVSDTEFVHCSLAIGADASGAVTVAGGAIAGNTTGVKADGGGTVELDNVWWASEDGPSGTDLLGTGDPILGTVTVGTPATSKTSRCNGWLNSGGCGLAPNRPNRWHRVRPAVTRPLGTVCARVGQ